jgi:hypothetical protein
MPGHPPATVARFNLRVLMEPPPGAFANQCDGEAAKNAGLGQNSQERPVTRQNHAFDAGVAVERPVVEASPVVPHDLAALGRVSQGGCAEILRVFRLPGFTPRGLGRRRLEASSSRREQ